MSSRNETAAVRYSAAYPTGRERMLEPRYGCAEEALLRRVASPTASPKGPQGAARERMLEPRYGCAEEALLRRVASPTASPKGPQGAARERI